MHVADDDDARAVEAGPEPDSEPEPQPDPAGSSDPVAPVRDAAPIARARTVPPRRIHKVYWWKEALIVLVFYAIFSWTRNQFGSNRIAAEGIPGAAFRNAERVIRWQQAVGFYPEPGLQAWYLENIGLIQLWNVFYGSAHFVVTIFVFAVLFWLRPAVFPQWRNTLAAMTALAIVGFAFFPLMPPRLLDQPCPWQGPGQFGGACIYSDLRGDDGTFGYVDTLAEFGGLWSFDTTALASISNQYAAMPSLHVGWAIWCAIATWPLLRRRWSRIAMLAYPALTWFVTIVTGNHFWIDGIGGIIVFGLGAVIGWGLHRWNQDRLDGRHLRLHTA